MSAEPTVSVIMPVHNAERYVAEATESILSQTFEDFELIIIDDGSTDRSSAVVGRYAAVDRRIRFISREHRGIPSTRNEAVQMAMGKYIAETDSDDVSLPHRLAKQVAYLEEHPECALVGCHLLLVDPEGAPIRVINVETSHEEIVAANLGFHSFFVPGGYMVRREALLSIGGFHEQVTLAEDRDMYLRLAELARLANIPEVLYKYRQHTANTCLRRRRELQQQVAAVVDAARTRRGLDAFESTSTYGIHDNEDRSITAMHRKWAWWALGAGNVKTARKHAFGALRGAPLSIESWRVFYCALRGY